METSQNCVINKFGTLVLVLVSLIVGFASSEAIAQFVPPPPVINGNELNSFSAADRKLLNSIYWNTLAVRQKLFVKVQDGTRVPDSFPDN